MADEEELLLGVAPVAATDDAPAPVEGAEDTGAGAITLFGGDDAQADDTAALEAEMMAAVAEVEAPAEDEDEDAVFKVDGRVMTKDEAKSRLPKMLYKKWKEKFGKSSGGDSSKFEIDGRPMTKAEAKEKLSKSDYKEWKSLHGKDKEEKKEKKKDKKSKDKKSKSKSDSKKKRKAEESDGDDDGADRLEGKRKRKESAKPKRTRTTTAAAADTQGDAFSQLKAAPQTAAAKKYAQVQRYKALSEATVNKMKTARQLDQAARQRGQPPMNRLMICKSVEIVLRRELMHEYLVADGVLDELAYWLFDPTTTPHELAPLDLRTIALEVLALFELEGVDNLGNAARRESKRGGDADLIDYEGIDSETLRNSQIGRAVNFVRVHPQELNSNKNKAVVLLQNLSRAFEGEERDNQQRNNVMWPSFGDRDVATPFDPIKTASEEFAASINRIDPKDPSSYMRVPPKRMPKSYITTMFLQPEQLQTQH